MQLLNRLRNEADMTLEEIGEYTGTSKQSVHSWHKGVNSPSGKRAVLLEKLYREKFPELHLTNEHIVNYGKMLPEEQFVSLPYVRIPARAGFHEMAAHEKDYGIKDTLPVLKRDGDDFRNCICIEVDGDSMEPQLRSGDIVRARLVDRGNWEYMAGGIYAISYSNFFVIKRVKNNDLLESGFLHLHSDNPQGGELNLPLDQIHYIWQVLRVVDGKVS